MSHDTARPSRSRREQTRMVGAIALIALVILFGVLNFDDVEVNWILGTWSTPLIVVIVVSALLGAAIDRVVVRRRRARRG